MFETAAEFSAVYLSLAAVLVMLVLFEKPLIALEEKRIEARKSRIKELEEETRIQKEIIYIKFKKIMSLEEKLAIQKKINSIDRETLRQERLKNSKEVKDQ